MLAEKISGRESGIVLYGITPPRAETPPDKLLEIARTQRERLTGLPIDGLIVYDIQDESSRTDKFGPSRFRRRSRRSTTATSTSTRWRFRRSSTPRSATPRPSA